MNFPISTYPEMSQLESLCGDDGDDDGDAEIRSTGACGDDDDDGGGDGAGGDDDVCGAW